MIIERCLPDIFVIEETKLCETFKTDAFFIPYYKKPMRRDRTQFGERLMQFVREGVICNRLPVYERSSLDLICSELLINKKKWVIFSIYRPPDSNIDTFFGELSTSLNSAGLAALCAIAIP